MSALCPVCNTPSANNGPACRSCGALWSVPAADSHLHALPPGTKLQGGMFSVGKVLGQGGFGITYLGSDVRLRRSVAIKEFFPQGCARQNTTAQAAGAMTVADYHSARTRFLDEARVLAQFQHPSI